MASNFYDMHLPDYTDLDNDTKERPGFRLGVVENDGGIGIDLGPIGDDPDGDTYYRIFLNTSEAEELSESLLQAIERAKQRIAGHTPHENRAKRP